MSICHADERYYRGKRPSEILKKKLPMALIHECCGIVLFDDSNEFPPGTKVVLVPNVLSEHHVNGSYENYEKGSGFRSSGIDGFMQEIVAMDKNRLVTFVNESDDYIFAITELVSVAVHAVRRFIENVDNPNKKIAVFGDGNVGFLVSLVIYNLLPDASIFVVGRHEEKLSNFSFVSKTFIEIPKDFEFDHAFECTGSLGAATAIDSIIKHINPQGTVMLLGVSEEKVPVNTRSILEKGLKFIGCSRSGYNDFVDAVKIMQDERTKKRIVNLITRAGSVDSIHDIYRVFDEAARVPFKLVFKWNL